MQSLIDFWHLLKNTYAQHALPLAQGYIESQGRECNFAILDCGELCWIAANNVGLQRVMLDSTSTNYAHNPCACQYWSELS